MELKEDALSRKDFSSSNRVAKLMRSVIEVSEETMIKFESVIFVGEEQAHSFLPGGWGRLTCLPRCLELRQTTKRGG